MSAAAVPIADALKLQTAFVCLSAAPLLALYSRSQQSWSWLSRGSVAGLVPESESQVPPQRAQCLGAEEWAVRPGNFAPAWRQHHSSSRTASCTQAHRRPAPRYGPSSLAKPEAKCCLMALLGPALVHDKVRCCTNQRNIKAYGDMKG